MRKKATIFCMSLLAFTFSLSIGQTYSEDFEDSDVSEWQQYRADEEMIQAIEMTSAPTPLVGGGDQVGFIQDLDGSYTGVAVVLTGDVMDANYTVESDVYVYENPTTSSYTGIVAYADSAHQGPYSHGYYVKLVADFDVNPDFSDLPRFRLYNNQLDFVTFSYSFSHNIDASGVDRTEGWHQMKVVVSTSPADSTVSYQCFYDDIDLGTYVDDSELRTYQGQAGFFSFNQSSGVGLPGYFDNFSVNPNQTSGSINYSEDFEDGDVSDWEQYRADEEIIQAVEMTSAPMPLVGGGDMVGYIQDLDGSYTGVAVVITGDVMDDNYTAESDVYV